MFIAIANLWYIVYKHPVFFSIYMRRKIYRLVADSLIDSIAVWNQHMFPYAILLYAGLMLVLKSRLSTDSLAIKRDLKRDDDVD